MFTQSELNLLQPEYFCILRICPSYAEVQSICTSTCWLIQKLRCSTGVMLHQKESFDTLQYHQHCPCYSVSDAIREIKIHDEYALTACVQ